MSTSESSENNSKVFSGAENNSAKVKLSIAFFSVEQKLSDLQIVQGSKIENANIELQNRAISTSMLRRRLRIVMPKSKR